MTTFPLVVFFHQVVCECLSDLVAWNLSYPWSCLMNTSQIYLLRGRFFVVLGDQFIGIWSQRIGHDSKFMGHKCTKFC